MEVEELGVMIDLSRGRVLSVDTIKQMALNAKRFGYTYVNLYMEDLFTLEEYPTFGYLRGRYSDCEIREIVAYCESINIEVFPAIQTLGHLEHFLRWNQSQNLKDTDQVLNVKSNEVRTFLEVLVNKCRSLFSSKKINVGMDEAFDLGQGSLLREGNKLTQKELYLNHLNVVVNLCKEAGFESVKIWSDMLFNIYSNAGGEGLYTVTDTEKFESLNSDVELIYWNYWSRNDNEYIESLNIHEKFTDKVSIALGIHTWGLPFYNSEQLNVTKAALKACEKKEIKDILFTIWGDDGSLFNLDSAIYGMYLSSVVVKDEEVNSKYFDDVTKLEYSSLATISNICDCGINPLQIIWNDPITNIQLKALDKIKIDLIKNNAKKMLITPHNINEEIYNLYLKCILNDIELYENEEVKKITIDEAIKDLKQLLTHLEKLWLKEAKINGIEELQLRFTAKLYRYKFLYEHYKNQEIIADRTIETGIVPSKESYNGISKATKFRW